MNGRRDELWTTLEKMSCMYPAMRFGQLIEFAALLASDNGDYSLEATTDEMILKACRSHLDERRSQMEKKESHSSPINASRRELLETLMSKHTADCPQASITGIILDLAHTAQSSVYDFEDEL